MLDLRPNNNAVHYGSDQMRKTNTNQLEEIEERHEGIKRLEGDIVQLHGIHRDISDIVRGHGEMLDNIESSVTQTEVQIDTSNKNLAKTLDLKSAVRRKRIICGLVLFVIIAIIVIVIVVVVVTQNKKK